MAVRCGGDTWEMEQIGERQDFECELTRLGFRHEDFAIDVRRAKATASQASWATNYAVRVTNLVTARPVFYWGGPGEQWVKEFVTDVGNGVYGAPTINHFAPGRRVQAAKIAAAHTK